MILEWIKTVGPILISWPIVGLIVILVFRKPLRALADRFTGEDVLRAKFGPVEFERVKAAVDQAESAIDRLYALSMSEDAFAQLKKLRTGNFGGFWLDPNLTVGLAAEINYFKILGYISFKKIADTRDLPTGDHPNENLSDYISVTPLGHEFIALREKAQERLAMRSSGRS
jgi:hypothetical protein